MTATLFQPLTKPTAAQMNALADAIAALEAEGGDYNKQFFGQEWTGPDSRWMFRRRFRWLAYDSTGALEDPAGVEDTITLGDGPAMLDLDSLKWLAPGKFYRVTGCRYAVELE